MKPKLEENKRKCTLCNFDKIENEFHFVIECPFYKTIRNNLYKQLDIKNESKNEIFEKLLTSKSVDIANKFGKYLSKAFNMRTNNISAQL